METNKIAQTQQLELKEVIKYLEDLTKSFQEGNVVVQKEEAFVVLSLPESVTVKVEAKSKKDKAKFALELSWRVSEECAAGQIKIGSKVPGPKKEEKVPEKQKEKTEETKVKEKTESGKSDPATSAGAKAVAATDSKVGDKDKAVSAAAVPAKKK
nr:amphi-Trp domain-containing protein [Desulfobulbaceae bacterium]